MSWRALLSLSLLLLTACTGTIGGNVDATGSDGGAPRDVPGLDASSAATDTPAATPPCVGVTCGAGAVCDPASGDCRCAPGFVDLGGSCMAAEPGDPSTRTAVDVCAAWTEGHRLTASASWTEGATECDSGAMSREALDDTLRRISMFRWFVGLPPVVDEAGRNRLDQTCANLMYRNGTIDHFPPETWRCYTADGAMGAGSSNLAYGTSNAADAIDLFVSDDSVPSLGHRRWVLNDPLGIVGIGFAGNSTCLGVFDGSGSGNRPWTSWPNPGPSPIAGMGALWSFHSHSLSLGAATVTMNRISDGSALAVTVSHPPDGYGPSTVSWAPMGWVPAAGEAYRVTVSSGGSDITYDVELVACD